MDSSQSLSRDALLDKVRLLEQERDHLRRQLHEVSLSPLLPKIFDHLPCSVFIKNEHLEVIYLNQELRKQVPLSARHLGPETMNRIFTPEALERGRQSDLSVLDSGIPDEREEYYSGLNIHAWFHLHKFRVICPVTHEKFIITLVRDISEVKKIERHLLRTQRMAELGSWTMHRTKNTLTCTQGAYALFGYMPGEITPPLDLFRSHVHPEDLPWLTKTIQRIRKSGTPSTGEFRIFKRDGSLAWLRMHISPGISEPNELPDLDGTFQDITSQKLLLQKQTAITRDLEKQRSLFESMADNLTDMLWAKDLNNRYLFGNKAIREQLLHSDEIPIKGKQDIFFAQRQRDLGWQHTFGESCMSSDDVVMKTNRSGIFTEDGLIQNTYNVLEVHKSPLHDSSGKLIGTVGTARNVTEQKMAEKELQEAKETAETASRAKATFLSNTGHEIRTPLNGLIGLLDLTLHSGLTPDQQENLIQARRSSTRLLLLLNNIIECADLQRGQVTVERNRFDLKETVNVCASHIAPQCAEKSIVLDINFAVPSPAPVLGDQAKVMRILDLILDNALKFTDGGTISIDVRRDPSSPECIEFTLQDTGCGIPKNKLGEIFSSFSQVEDGLERSYEGAGLGLSIAKGLVDLLRGTISATPLSKGTKLQFSIPLAKADAPGSASPAKSMGERQLTVLVVDDNVVNRMVLDKTLQREHHLVHTASTGREAVEKFKAHDFDIIFMDIQMPEMSGIEATRAIRVMEQELAMPRVPIIAVTANALASDREQFIQAGMDELMLKPVSRDELLQAVEEIISPPRSEPETEQKTS